MVVGVVGVVGIAVVDVDEKMEVGAEEDRNEKRETRNKSQEDTGRDRKDTDTRRHKETRRRLTARARDRWRCDSGVGWRMEHGWSNWPRQGCLAGRRLGLELSWLAFLLANAGSGATPSCQVWVVVPPLPRASAERSKAILPSLGKVRSARIGGFPEEGVQGRSFPSMWTARESVQDSANRG